MNKLLRNITLLALLVSICLPTAAQTNILRGKVVSIADGDTITILDDTNREHRIRLAGIDAPESSESFGTASTENLTKLVFRKLVRVEWYKHDRYGRIVGNVFFAAQDVGLEQVKAGLAWHYKEYQNEQSSNDRRAYAEAELEAREKKKGLWTDPSPLPPWIYRHGGSIPPVSTIVAPIRVISEMSKQSGHVYIRGPRGGCYYLDSSSHKKYVEHSLCK